MGQGKTIWTAPDAHRVMPWKNGLGETLEVARHPDGQSLADFDWRVSVAPVVADGAFSVFPGIERTIAVIEGAGMVLSVADDRTQRLEPGTPFTYDGGLAIDGRLVDGPVRDFNVMARRGRFTGELILAGGQTAIAGAGAILVAFALQGAWNAEADDDGGRLARGASLQTTAALLSLHPETAGSQIAIAILRRSA